MSKITTDYPTDLWTHVFEHLTILQLVKIKRVSKQWQAIVENLFSSYNQWIVNAVNKKPQMHVIEVCKDEGFYPIVWAHKKEMTYIVSKELIVLDDNTLDKKVFIGTNRPSLRPLTNSPGSLSWLMLQAIDLEQNYSCITNNWHYRLVPIKDLVFIQAHNTVFVEDWHALVNHSLVEMDYPDLVSELKILSNCTSVGSKLYTLKNEQIVAKRITDDYKLEDLWMQPFPEKQPQEGYYITDSPITERLHVDDNWLMVTTSFLEDKKGLWSAMSNFFKGITSILFTSQSWFYSAQSGQLVLTIKIVEPRNYAFCNDYFIDYSANTLNIWHIPQKNKIIKIDLGSDFRPYTNPIIDMYLSDKRLDLYTKTVNDKTINLYRFS